MKRILTLSAFGLLFTFQGAQALPLTDSVDLNGEIRARNEFQMNYDLDGDRDGDDNFGTLRTTLGFGVRPFDGLDVGVKFRDWRFFGEEGVYGNAGNNVDFYEGYFNAKFKDGKWALKVGRQEVVLGTGRLFSNYNNYKGLYHDAAIASYLTEEHKFHFFTARHSEASTGAGGLGGGTGAGVDFGDDYSWAGWYNWTRNENAKLNAYLISTKLNTMAADPTIYTIGASYDDDSFEKLFFGVELTLQMGEYSALEVDHSAFAFHGHIGGKFGDGQHRLWLDIDVASGSDDDPDAIEDYNSLFGEVDLGEMNLVGFSNIMHGALRYRGKFADDKLQLDLGIHMFTLMSEDGGLYQVNSVTGMTSKVGNANGDDTDAGMEIDGVLTYTWNEYLSMKTGLSYFAPGDAWGMDLDGAVLFQLGATGRF